MTGSLLSGNHDLNRCISYAPAREKTMFRKISILIFLISSFSLFSQNNEGDFKLSQSGYWDDSSVWQIYESGLWRDAAAGEIPNLSSKVYIPRYLEVSVVQAGMLCKDIDISGTLEIANPSRSSIKNELTITGNAVVMSSGTIVSNGTINNTSIVSIGGNLINEGKILSRNADRYGAIASFSIRFVGSNSAVVSGDGDFDLKEVVISKEYLTSSLRQKTPFGDVDNYIITKGTLVFDGNFSQKLFVDDDSYDIIKDKVAIVVDNEKTNLILPDAVKVYGQLICNNGSITVGDNAGEGIKLDFFNALVKLNNGKVNVNGNVDISYGDLQINGGSLDVQTAGEQNLFNSFYVDPSNGNLDVSAGEIIIHNGSVSESIFNASPESLMRVGGLVVFKNESGLENINITTNIVFSKVNFDIGSNSVLLIENSDVKFEEEISTSLKHVKIENSSVNIGSGIANFPLFKTDANTKLHIVSGSKSDISNLFVAGKQTIGELIIDMPNGSVDIVDDLYFSNGSFSGSIELIGGKINVLSTANLILEGNISNIGGEFNVKEGSSIFQLDNSAVNFGDVIIERKEVLNKLNHNYWSSPVNNDEFSAADVWEFGDYDEEYNSNKLQELTGTWHNIDKDAKIKSGKGIFVPGPNNSNSIPKTLYFKGSPNNGDIDVDLVYNESGYNLVGNPYPSSIDYMEFLKTNETKVAQSVYTWSHEDENSANNQMNTSGLLGTVPANALENNQIKTSQGFVVKLLGDSGNSVKFNNNQRLSPEVVLANQSVFNGYKLWVSLSHDDIESQLMIAALSEATDVIDQYDVPKFEYDNSMSISSYVPEGKYKILSLKLENDEHVIPLSITINETGVYKISKVQLENQSVNLAVQLRDKQSGVMTNLLDSDYEFNISNTGSVNDRFEIIISHSGQLSEEDLISADFKLINTDNELTILGDDISMSFVQAISMDGKSQSLRLLREVYGESVYGIERLNTGVYIIYGVGDDGKVYKGKIIK